MLAQNGRADEGLVEDGRADEGLAQSTTAQKAGQGAMAWSDDIRGDERRRGWKSVGLETSSKRTKKLCALQIVCRLATREMMGHTDCGSVRRARGFVQNFN